MEKVKLVEVEEVKEWEMEKILNKRKVRRVVKYLIWQKRFIVEHDNWEKEEGLENIKEIVAEFEERLDAEVRRQKKLDEVEERNFRREELSIRIKDNKLYFLFYFSFTFTFSFILELVVSMMSQVTITPHDLDVTQITWHIEHCRII